MAVRNLPGLPVNKRSFGAFLSHAHVDKGFTDRLFHWLSTFVQLKVWYDSVEFAQGLVASKLGSAIEDCRSAIIILSNDSIASGWVEEEWNICIEQKNSFPDFQIVTVNLDGCVPPAAMRARKWLDAPAGAMSPSFACQMIEALHWHQTEPSGIERPTFYLSRGSRDGEVDAADATLARVRRHGCRFVRDAPDQFSFSEERIKSIIASTGGVVAFLSDRGQGQISRYILDEIRFAADMNVPTLVVRDPAVPSDLLAPFAKARLVSHGETDIEAELLDFVETAPKPLRGTHCFLGHEFSGKSGFDWRLAKRVVEVSAGLPCASGDDLTGDAAQRQIVEKISQASLAIFDITGDLLNTCIEAGVARGCGTRFELVCQGPRRRPPFLFRDKQVFFYETEVELLGLLRKLTSDVRRVVT